MTVPLSWSLLSYETHKASLMYPFRCNRSRCLRMPLRWVFAKASRDVPPSCDTRANQVKSECQCRAKPIQRVTTQRVCRPGCPAVPSHRWVVKGYGWSDAAVAVGCPGEQLQFWLQCLHLLEPGSATLLSTSHHYQLSKVQHESHETCHSVTFHFMKKDSKPCCDTTTPHSIHTKDESKCDSALAFIFDVNWPIQWV